jgi:hypothetical protein
MRLWSLHPRHLDSRGLVALWREGLLARAVLRGDTRGYRHHPQLERFRAQMDPMAAIDCYLSRILDEARARGYEFNAAKIAYRSCSHVRIQVTDGQLNHEWTHLLVKLEVRDPARWRVEHLGQPTAHGCFHIVPGPISSWERP